MSNKEVNIKKLTDLFTYDNIEILPNFDNQDDVILKLLENLALNYGIGNVKDIFKQYSEGFLKKEPIDLTPQVHLYHFRLNTLKELHFALAIRNTDTKDECPRIIIVAVSPNNRPDVYLTIEKALKSLFVQVEQSNDLFKLTEKSAFWDYIQKHDVEILQDVYAGDIMLKVETVLDESHNLKDAIDLFVKSKLLNIPVVDKEFDLIGEVNANELMKICLPRHMIWMSNINTIAKFEPFYDMLEHEDITWLAEIMTHDIAVVQVEDFAMKAAISMTHLESNYAYVLDDKKLVGVITLEQFLNKILRQ